MKTKKIIFYCFIFLAFLFVPFFQTKAEGIKIIPSLSEDLVDPGEILKKTIKVTNISNETVMMYAMVKDFKPKNEYGVAELLEPVVNDESSISSWIDITDQGISFGPNEEKVIPYNIVVPENAGPGGHYGAIAFGTKASKPKPGDAEKGASVSVSQQTASLVLLRVAGDIVEKADVREFFTDKKIYSTPFETKFNVRIENLGNVHIKPRGMIQISNMFGKEVAAIPVNDKEFNVLPQSVRVFDENIWKGDFGFGKYTADLVLSYGMSVENGGQGKQSLSIKRYFWIFPMKIVMFLILGLFILGALTTLFLKSYKKKAVQRVMKQMGVKEGYSIRRSQSPIQYYIMTFLAILIIVTVVMVIIYFIFL